MSEILCTRNSVIYTIPYFGPWQENSGNCDNLKQSASIPSMTTIYPPAKHHSNGISLEGAYSIGPLSVGYWPAFIR